MKSSSAGESTGPGPGTDRSRARADSARLVTPWQFDRHGHSRGMWLTGQPGCGHHMIELSDMQESIIQQLQSRLALPSAATVTVTVTVTSQAAWPRQQRPLSSR